MPQLVGSSEVSSIAVKIISGWSIPDHVPETVTEFHWAKGDLSAFVTELRVQGDVLQLKWDEVDGFSRVADDPEHKDLFGEPFQGRLASGWAFAADNGIFKSNGVVEGHYWSMEDPTQEAVVWVSEIHGLERMSDLAISGNLCVLGSGTAGSTEKVFRRGHRFHGAYTYYLVSGPSEDQRKDRWFLIIDGGTSRLVRRDVFNDVLALQFVLGTAFYFDVLEGLSSEGRCVARLGGRYGRDHRHRPRTEDVVPTHFVQEHWPAAFFEAISKTYRERPDLRLHIALSFYLDGLASFHVEGRYLVQHVGLEAFAYWLLKADGDDAPALVDKARWSAWLKESKDTIRSLAAPGFAETLYSKVTSIPARRASSMVVEVAFQRYGLSVHAEMAEELENGRNTVVHTAVMFEERREDVNDYLRRIAIVRTMLTALVAKVVGYQGAILGWERDYRRPYKEADASWWAVNPVAREAALQFFNIEGSLPAAKS
jgi:hypothetical protein